MHSFLSFVRLLDECNGERSCKTRGLDKQEKWSKTIKKEEEEDEKDAEEDDKSGLKRKSTAKAQPNKRAKVKTEPKSSEKESTFYH